MKTLGVIFSVAMICLAFLALIPSRDSNRLLSRTESQVEEVVYMSDINELVTAVMLYGVTNGITFQGTNYVFVVEDVGPATPVSKRETTFHFNDSTVESYLIEGELSGEKLVELGICSSLNNWRKKPVTVEVGTAVTSIGVAALAASSTLANVILPDTVTEIKAAGISGTTALTSLTIPSSVNIIANNAFSYTDNLKSVTVERPTSNMPSPEKVFWGLSSGCVIHFTDMDFTVP